MSLLKIIFGFVLCYFSLQTGFAQNRKQYLRACGIYNIIGKLECVSAKSCSVLVYPGSLSEFKINLKSIQVGASHLVSSFIKSRIKLTDVQLKSAHGIILDSIPTRSKPSDSDKAFELIEEMVCK